MAGKWNGGSPVPVSDLATDLLDPVLRKRAGLSIDLVQSWAEIVGDRLAGQTRPEKIAWPRRAHEDDPFEPATLVIACDGMAAIRVQHEAQEIIARANAFLGFNAIGRVKLVQKPMTGPASRKPKAPRPLREAERSRLDAVTSGIEDDALRESLKRLGESIMGSKK